jgi:hypothetical protein
MFIAAALPPAPILLHADEYRFNGSRRAGPSGLWRVNLNNIGEDEHDVQVLNRQTKKIVGRSRIYLPGEHGTITIRLRPGTYTLFCGVANHRALGMKWILTVRKPTIRRTAA